MLDGSGLVATSRKMASTGALQPRPEVPDADVLDYIYKVGDVDGKRPIQTLRQYVRDLRGKLAVGEGCYGPYESINQVPPARGRASTAAQQHFPRGAGWLTLKHGGVWG